MTRNIQDDRERKLPVGQFTILALVRISEPIALTSVYPYLPAMIQGFDGVKAADVGFWTGTASAIFSIAQCLSAIPWGRASDKYGRKPILILGVLNTMITSLLWGFSTTLPMALTARALSGAGNGNVGIIRTMVAELCPWKELQPRAFSLMPLVFSIGSVIGPIIGTLANPLQKPSKDHTKGSFLWNYPYLLPNLVAAIFFLFSLAVGILFLRETIDTGRKDYGIILGDKISAALATPILNFKALIFRQPLYTPIPTSEPQTPVKSVHDEENASADDEDDGGNQIPVKLAPPSWSEALNTQALLFLASYSFLAMHNTAFDQIISVFMHQARTGSDIVDSKPPLHFNKGFGMTSQQIGFLFTINGCLGMVFQSLVFPPVARKYGTYPALVVALFCMTIVYGVIPFTSLIEDAKFRQLALFGVWMVKTCSVTFAFPACTILLTNTASSIRILGTINGITTALGALGRAIGPSLVGYFFSWGVRHGLLVAPFWVLSSIGILSLLPLIWAREGEGFGDESHMDEEDWDVIDHDVQENSEDSVMNTTAEPVTKPIGSMHLRKTSSFSSKSHSSSTIQRDESQDGVAPLEYVRVVDLERNSTHQTTAATSLLLHPTDNYSSFAIQSDVEEEIENDDRNDNDNNRSNDNNNNNNNNNNNKTENENDNGNRSLPSMGLSRVVSREGRSNNKQRTNKVRRRSTTPIGSGIGFRRLSSNLGASRSGYGSGSEFGG